MTSVILVAVLVPTLLFKGFFPTKVAKGSLGSLGALGALGAIGHNTTHDSSHVSDIANEEKKYVGSLLSSIFSSLFWPLDQILLWPVHYFLGSEDEHHIGSEIVTDHHDKQTIKSEEELKQIIEEAISQHMRQYEEEIERIKVTLHDHEVTVDPETMGSIDEKYGAGAWSYSLAAITQKQPPPSQKLEPFHQELSGLVGEMVAKVINIKTDVWTSVQQYDAAQRELVEAKISELKKSGEVKGPLDLSQTVLAHNLRLEVGSYLQDSLLSDSKDSAVWKLALLWNLALQLNDLEDEIIKLGISAVMESSHATKQIVEVSIAQKDSDISNFATSLSSIALEVDVVKTREMGMLTSKVNDEAVLILNTISSITQSKLGNKETLALDTVTKINEKVKIISEIPVPVNVGEVVSDVISEFMDTKKADAEGIKLILFLSPVIIESAKSDLIDATFGAGTWSAILSTLLKKPSARSSLSPEAEIFKEILRESVGSMLEEIASVGDDVWELLQQLDGLQNDIVDSKLFSLINGINNKLNMGLNLFKIPGEVGTLIKANLAETFGEFLVQSGLDMKSLKTSLFDFALQLNEVKLEVVDTGVTGALEQTLNLVTLTDEIKGVAVTSIKEKLLSKQTQVETIIASLFDLTVQIDDAKRDEAALTISAGLNPVLEKIGALIDLVEGIVSGEAIASLTETINTKLVKEASVVESLLVEQLVKTVNPNNGGHLEEIQAVEKELVSHPNISFADLIKVNNQHQHH